MIDAFQFDFPVLTGTNTFTVLNVSSCEWKHPIQKVSVAFIAPYNNMFLRYYEVVHLDENVQSIAHMIIFHFDFVLDGDVQSKVSVILYYTEQYCVVIVDNSSFG